MNQDYLVNMFSLEGQVAVVTGGASGLGNAVARHLCAAGVVFVVLVAVTRELRRRNYYGGDMTPPDLLSNCTCSIASRRSLDLHISYTVSAARLAPTMASISTPVRAVAAAVTRTCKR